MWFKKIDKDLPIPFKEYKGHKSFVYYKKTKSGKNISLNLAWLKYNGAIQLLSQERILSFCLLENSKMKGLIRKGSKKDIILKESKENER